MDAFLRQILGMNITQILLGSTAAMLLAALILSFSAMKDGEKEDGRRVSAKELMDENARLQAEVDRLRGGRPMPTPQPAELPDAMSAAKLKELEERNRELEAAKEAAEKKQQQAEAETLAMNERASGQHDKAARRAKLISQAMVMAQVKEVAKIDGQVQFVVLDVKQSNVRQGTKLAIRRNTGIVGEVIITRMDAEATVADPLPNAVGKVDVKQGDELIVPPL